MKALCGGLLTMVAMAGFACAQSSQARIVDQSAKERLIGAWRLVRIESPGPDGKPDEIPQPQAMLIYTLDGHMSVQLMYPKEASSLSNEYVLNGYEASFGSYEVDEETHTLTHHVQGSVTGGLLVGRDLPRVYAFTKEGRLLIKSARQDEHWFVLWEHYR